MLKNFDIYDPKGSSALLRRLKRENQIKLDLSVLRAAQNDENEATMEGRASTSTGRRRTSSVSNHFQRKSSVARRKYSCPEMSRDQRDELLQARKISTAPEAEALAEATSEDEEEVSEFDQSTIDEEEEADTVQKVQYMGVELDRYYYGNQAEFEELLQEFNERENRRRGGNFHEPRFPEEVLLTDALFPKSSVIRLKTVGYANVTLRLCSRCRDSGKPRKKKDQYYIDALEIAKVRTIICRGCLGEIFLKTQSINSNELNCEASSSKT